MQRAIFIDRDKCIGCYACVVACKLEHNLPPHPVKPPVSNPQGPELIQVYQVGPELREDKVYQYFQPISCRHCSDAPCVYACLTGALQKEPGSGIVTVDTERCVGCWTCILVCPYGVIRRDKYEDKYEGKIAKCDLCIHRLGVRESKGRHTACEAACPARAIHVGTTGEISALIGQKAAEKAGDTAKTA